MTRRAEPAMEGRLLRAVIADQDELQRLVAEAISFRVPSVGVAAIDRVLANIDAVIGSIPCAGAAQRAQAGTRLRAVKAPRSIGAGHSPADLLVAERIQRQVIVDHVRDTGSRLGSKVGEVLATTEILLAACWAVHGKEAGADQNPELSRRAADRERAELVRDLLWATPDSARLAPTAIATKHAVDIDHEYLTLRARPAPGQGIDSLALALGFSHGRSNGGGLGAVVNGDLVGFVTSLPQGPVRGVAGLGPARPLGLLHESFLMATRALQTACQRDMTGVYMFNTLGVLPAILSDTATGAALCRRYFAPLGGTDFAEEIVETLRAYLSCGMNAPRAARVLCVHPNTVRYRIARFEELTGVTFRGNRTASFEVLWALEHRGHDILSGDISAATAI
jgi:PucR C-terminal helix-turn-helix domain